MPNRVRNRRRGPASLLCLALLAGCASHHPAAVSHRAAPAPGGPDPWGPYIREASERFGVPESWIRAVMQQESGGHQFIDGQQTTSSAGAMGLMQVVPGTYDELRARYGLGGDPYDPHDNVMAGAAYIREMYDRFGAPGFLAAYNAGPRRLDSFLNNGTPLPPETVSYLASVAPRLGDDPPMTGPLAVYAGARARRYASAAPQPLPPVEPEPERAAPSPPPPSPPPAVQSPAIPSAAPVPPEYEPPATASALAPSRRPEAARPPAPIPQPPAPPAFVPAPFVRPPPPILRASAPAREADGGWGIQVGAFATPALAREAADAARQRLGARGEATVGVAARPGGSVLFRARVMGLSAESARAGCARVASSGGACILVTPESS